MSELLTSLIPIITLFIAAFSAYAAYQANQISSSVRKFQENVFLNDEEIKISQEILEKLTFYNVWCNDRSQIGSLDINYNNTESESYDSRDNAFTVIPNEVKVLSLKLQTRGELWKNKLILWEEGLLFKVGENYAFNEEILEEKLLQFKGLRAELLQV